MTARATARARRIRARHVVPCAGLVVAVACGPIPGTERSIAPTNVCAEHPCEAYPPGPRAKAACSEARCELPGRPSFPFTIVVNVPETSFFAPGETFVLTSVDLFSTTGPPNPRCQPPQCLALPALGQATGGYFTTSQAATEVGLPVPDGASLPVRVTFVPLASSSSSDARALGLPVDVSFASSRVVVDENETSLVRYDKPVPVGRYLRVAYPEAPFDAYFPPAINEVRVGTRFNDDFTLGTSTAPLDDPTGDSRLTFVARAEGLDGFHVWLADSASGRRISTLRALAGTLDGARLDTSGQSQGSTTALRDGVDVVVAPPEGWIAVPRLQATLIGGQGLHPSPDNPLEYPALPPPAQIEGVVGEPDGVLTGIPARVSLRSQQVRLADGSSSPLLRYEATVATDDSGRFTTVVPPGVYDVQVQAAEGTGFGQQIETVELPGPKTTFTPPRRSVVTGRAIVGDGRPLAGADVIAVPSAAGRGLLPRPARTRTAADGSFRFELDQGEYDVAVEPQGGTGFPWVVTVRAIGPGEADLGTIVVPAPTRLTFTIRDPSTTGNPIVHAVVRIYAEAESAGAAGGAQIEVARTTTDEAGRCEILLAEQPR